MEKMIPLSSRTFCYRGSSVAYSVPLFIFSVGRGEPNFTESISRNFGVRTSPVGWMMNMFGAIGLKQPAKRFDQHTSP